MSSASVLSYDEAQEITDILSGDKTQEPRMSCFVMKSRSQQI